jgi:uncharacterized membrane protein YphA (DoxX/SURF4 family)
MQNTSSSISKFLYVIEGVGAVFVAFYLVAYLAGLPTTNVLHSEDAFRYPLFSLGIVLLVMILGAVVLAIRQRR